ncbi:hypothetical protein LTR70_003019 [Exophiala xenobiotica]|uniref:Zn(2)-C6 fungal-type domain-containing protein n=1 Tax=Lithohypha guttulata TaxID=1690604 RepID=A0ABR0K8K6_9EURO|nr:hypothetical protein LTR24_005699 [Lithohypha guttulata]KAK5324389.1 hypothetical protein LTR70_003019 [Exophiala xenobiotica]
MATVLMCKTCRAQKKKCERSQGADKCKRCIDRKLPQCVLEYKIGHPAPREAVEALADPSGKASVTRNTGSNISYASPTSNHTNTSSLLYAPTQIEAMDYSDMVMVDPGIAPAPAAWGQSMQAPTFLPNMRRPNTSQPYAISSVAARPLSMQNRLRYPEKGQDDPSQSDDGQSWSQNLSSLHRDEPPDSVGYMNGTGAPRGTLGDTEQYDWASSLAFATRPTQHSNQRTRSRSPRRKADQRYRDRPEQL